VKHYYLRSKYGFGTVKTIFQLKNILINESGNDIMNANGPFNLSTTLLSGQRFLIGLNPYFSRILNQNHA